MKNKSFIKLFGTLLIFFLALPSSLKAQEFNAGVFAGINASQVDGDYYSGFNKLGLNGGVFVNREISSNFFWQLEIRYAGRGAYSGFALIDPNIDRTIYRYLELPVSLHYIFNDKVQTELGIAPDVLLDFAMYDGSGKLDPSLYPENHRFGLNGFIGVHYWYSRTASVGLRYTYGLLSFRDPQEYYTPFWLKGYHHNVLSLVMTFRVFHP